MTKEETILHDARGREIRAGQGNRVWIKYPEDHMMYGIILKGTVDKIEHSERHGAVLTIIDSLNGVERVVPAKFASRIYDRKKRKSPVKQ
jgi:hypothetical protein